MKILTLCQRGNNRSVILATLLKEEHGLKDVIPAGVDTLTPETLEMLCDWANHIILTTSEITIPDKYSGKFIYINVGPDRVGHTHNAEMQTFFRENMPTIKEFIKI
jgi:hypothetical protein